MRPPTPDRTTYMSEPSFFIRSIPLVLTALSNAIGLAVAGMVAMAVPWSLLSGGVSPIWAGAAAAAIHLPVALGLFAGGALTDRVGARPCLLFSGLAAVLAMTAAAGLAMLRPGDAVALVALLALSNGLRAPGGVALDARVPELARLAGMPVERANGLREIADGIAQAAGPVVGVLLVETAGLAGTCAVATGALGVAFLLDLLAFPRFRRRGGRTDATARRGGMAILTGDPALRSVVLLGMPLVAVFASLDEILVPSLALAGGLGAVDVALFLTIAGAGALLSAGLYTAWGHRPARRTVLVGGIATAAAGLSILATAPAAVGFLAAPALIGIGVGALAPAVVTAVHRRVPAAERGRALGTLSAVVLVAQPAATATLGPATAVLGLDATTAGLAAVAVLLAVVAPLLPGLRALDTDHPPRSPEVPPMRRTLLVTLLLAVVVGGGIAVASLGAPDAPPAVATPAGPVGIGALGRIEPASRALRVGAPSGSEPARVEAVLVQAGDRVRAGDVLARLADHPVREAAVGAAETQVRVAEAELARVRSGARPGEIAAQAARIVALEAQLRLADQTRERRAQLLSAQAATPAQMDDATAQVARLRAEIATARAVHESLATVRVEDVAVAEAALARARADLRLRRAEASLSTIVAPIDGTVLAVHARPGERQGADGIATLADVTRMEVVAEIYETDAPRLRPGQPAEVRLPMTDGALPARVREIGWLVRRNDAIGTDPVARIDARVVEVRLALDPDAARRVERLTNMQVAVSIAPAPTEP
jgi:HlyD family secretion protein